MREMTKGGRPSLVASYRSQDPERQKKLEDLVGIREAYRHQRRIWLWMVSLSIVSSAILLRRSTSLALLFAFVCLGLGLFLIWNFAKCTRAIRLIDKGLAPYRIREKGAKK